MDGFVRKVGWRPVALASAYSLNEIAEQNGTFLTVPNLRVELNAPYRTIDVAKSGELHIMCTADGFELISNGQDGIPMTHPNLRLRTHPLQQRILDIEGHQIGPAIFA